MTTRFTAHLRSRGIVQVSGVDSLRFLQGLVTNDIHAICGPNVPTTSTSAFLNGRGRLLFGTLMHRADHNRYLMDLPLSKVSHLIRHLTQYRLRAKVDIADVSKDHSVWAIVGSTSKDAVDSQTAACGFLFEDPRLRTLGQRAIVHNDFEGFQGFIEAEETDFTRLRILNGIPDDSDFDDTPLPLDLALHLLNGVSFNKGCYLGQELTARSHFTGVLRKRITPIAVVDHGINLEQVLSMQSLPFSLLSSREDLNLAKGSGVIIPGKSKRGGTVTSSVDNIGLAVLKLSDTFNGGDHATVCLDDGRSVIAWRPSWWSADSEAVSSER